MFHYFPVLWQGIGTYFSFHFIIVMIISLRVFHTNFSRLFSTGVWVTANLLKFPGLFSVSWPISTRPHYFQVLQSLYKSFGGCTECDNYNGYNRHFHVPHFFQFPSNGQVLIFLFVLFCSQPRQQTLQFSKFSFFLIIIRSGRLA